MIDQTWIFLGLAGFLGIPCLAIALGSIGEQWSAFRQRRLELAAEARKEEGQNRTQMLRALHRRVAVLETLATDPGQRLAQEIEQLNTGPARGQTSRATGF